jgi:hypothetical protein
LKQEFNRTVIATCDKAEGSQGPKMTTATSDRFSTSQSGTGRGWPLLGRLLFWAMRRAR